MTERMDVQIPGLSEEREADDLEAALTGVKGISRMVVDTATQVISIDFEPDLIDRSYIERIINKTGYRIAAEDR